MERPAAVDALAKMARARPDEQYAFAVGAISMRAVVDYIEWLEGVAQSFADTASAQAASAQVPTLNALRPRQQVWGGRG